MALITQTIETTGIVNAQRHRLLDESLLPIAQPDVDITEREWLKAVASNPAFYFLKDAEEDIYTLTDGKPFND
jgi:hypothetical protein